MATTASGRKIKRELAFYVAEDGNDGWSGKRKAADGSGKHGPFATITQAIAAIRTLKPEVRSARPITVYINGKQVIRETIVFGPEDSGTEENPITYRPYPKEPAIITSERRIDGWRQAEGGVWKTTVPGVQEGEWYFRQLFVNGTRAQRVRLPKEGFFTIDGNRGKDTPNQFRYKDDDIKPEWAARGDVEYFGLQWWQTTRQYITAVDDATKTVTLTGACSSFERTHDHRYYIENAPEALGTPGEWYLDRKTGELSYLPREGENIDTIEATAPTLLQLVRIEGDAPGGKLVHDINFVGLTFEESDWTIDETGYFDVQAAYVIPGVFEANCASAISIEDCTFRHLGNAAIAFVKGCAGNRIIGNEIYDIGAGGVKIGDCKVSKEEAEQTEGNVITDNDIHHIGEVYPGGCGVWVGHSGDNVISHNHIHDTYYTGISVGWTWGFVKNPCKGNVIEQNYIHDIGRWHLCDMGGVYLLGPQHGTVVRNNLIHDVWTFDYGAAGIYPDAGSCDMLIENNIVYDVKYSQFQMNFGLGTVLRNNIFAFGKWGQIHRGSNDSEMDYYLTCVRNIVCWNEGELLGDLWYDDRFKIDFNIYFRTDGAPFDLCGASLEQWRARGHDKCSIIGDPLFRDLEKRDFRLRPESPAFKVGFEEIDMSKVGPRKRSKGV
jgi:hypothetical protein